MARALILVAILGLAGAGSAGRRPPGTEAQANDQRPTTNDKGDTAIRAVEIPAFTIIGIEARTTNAKEATAEGIIGKQWQNFFSEGIPQRIPNKIDSNFYAVYYDYASDHNGEYSYLIGAKVKDGTAPPSGMVAKQVRTGKYAVLTSDKGPFPKVVPATWTEIFGFEDEGKLKRAYQTDFELYDERAKDPQNGQIDIYIGLK
jgi:predicted transcriptional regulator YdeE